MLRPESFGVEAVTQPRQGEAGAFHLVMGFQGDANGSLPESVRGSG